MKRILVLLLFAGMFAHAQNVRYDAPFPSVTSQYTTPFLVANVPPNSPTLSVCHSPANAVPCTNYVTTYNSAAVACPNGAQDTPQPQPSACQSTGDAQGNIGFWAPVGTYDYTVCIVGTVSCFGPYTVTLGGAGSGSLVLQTNGTNNGSQTKLNLVGGPNITIIDNGTGTDTFSAPNGAAPNGPTNSIQTNSGSSSFNGASGTSAPPGLGNLPAQVALDWVNGVPFVTPDYALNYSPTSPTTLVQGSNTLTFAFCPIGMTGAETVANDLPHFIRINPAVGDTNPTEWALITGGNCALGSTNATLTFSAAFSHIAGYTISSSTSGIQEAIRTFSGGPNTKIELLPRSTYQCDTPIFYENGSSHFVGNYAPILNASFGPCLVMGESQFYATGGNLFSGESITVRAGLV